MAVESPAHSAESMHRIRRLLRVLRIIAAHMAADRRPTAANAAHLAGRIGAIGRVALAGPMGIDLESMLRDELCVHTVHRTGIEISGPPLLLNADCAPFFSLVVHELTTNAVKFGALAYPEGRLTVTWRIDGTGECARLLLDWREAGVPIGEGGRVHGFGTELLQRLLASELRGDGKMLFLGTGVRCMIAIPTREALFLNE